MDEPRHLDAKTLGAAALAAALWALCVGVVAWHGAALPDWDPYYHLRLSEIMGREGLVVKDFHWTTESLWNDAFFDKDWLFHVFMIPFVTYLDGMAAGRVVLVLTAFAIAFCWALVYQRLGARHLVALMLLTLFCAGHGFFSRMVLCRAHLFSMAFLGLGLLLLLRRSRWGLLVLSAVYSLSYTGSWQIVPVAALFDLCAWPEKRRRPAELLFPWALAGIVAGTLVNPYFPTNLTGGVAQNLMVLKTKWLGAGVDIVQGAELRPLPLKRLFTLYLPILAIFGATLVHVARTWRNSRPRGAELFLGALALVYFLMTLASLRFTEYFVPVAMAFAVAHWRSRLPFELTRWRLAGLVGAVLIYGAVTVDRVRADAYRKDIRFAATGQWMKTHLKPGQVVFTGDWDDSAILFYLAPEFRYLVMLEPYFMYAHSPEKYRLWRKLCLGRSLATADTIRREFNSTAVFVPRDAPGLRRRLDDDPGATLAFAGVDGERFYLLSPQ